jgi:hypothetical protein
MDALMLYCLMGLVVFFIILAIIHGAESHKSYIATPTDKPSRAATEPSRSKRAQEVWNRLNPKIYLDDDETEPLPDRRRREKAKQG